MLTYTLPLMRSVAEAPHVLEIGSGAGNFSIMLASAGYDVCGLEVSDVAVDWARENAAAAGANVQFFVGDVTKSWSLKGPFDQIVDGHCLHCIIGEDRARCLEQIRQALAPGGIFIALTMCGDVRSESLLKQFDGNTNQIVVDGQPIRYIGAPGDICDEIRSAGFVIEQTVVHPRANDDDQDDLVVVARRPD